MFEQTKLIDSHCTSKKMHYNIKVDGKCTTQYTVLEKLLACNRL